MNISTWILIFAIWLTAENLFITLNDIRQTLKMCEKAAPYDHTRLDKIDGALMGNYYEPPTLKKGKQ